MNEKMLNMLGATNRDGKDREAHDYYATDPVGIDRLLKVFDIPQKIYECACGRGDLSERLIQSGRTVISSDLYERGYDKGAVGVDFLSLTSVPSGFSILTNPPFSKALEFVEKALDIVEDGNYVIMLLRLNFLEGKKRKAELWDKAPPKFIVVNSERLLCAKNADFEGMRKSGGSVVAYAWYIWEKGYTGDTVVKWS